MNNNDSPEQLLDAFKAAALSVTKLYKTSASAQGKARTEGYQDCLDDLLSLLNKESIGLREGEGSRIRRWVVERLDGRESPAQTAGESDDETEKTEAASSPEIQHRPANTTPAPPRSDPHTRTETAPPAIQPTVPEEPVEIQVPTQETFTFQSSHPYPQAPQESYLNLANLDLSDSRSQDAASSGPSPQFHPSRSLRPRHGSARRSGNHLGWGAGQKRKLNLAEFFDVKDMFGGNGGGGKRNRHA